MLDAAIVRMSLSVRGYDRVLKVARTIADLAGADRIQAEQLAEALQFRMLCQRATLSGMFGADVKDPTIYGLYLWLFTALLFGRVVGQLVVVWAAPRWLPPMEQWQSGLLPYRGLLVGQAVVLTLMVWISVDFSRGAGFWVEPRPRLGLAALVWSYVYFAAMIFRYVVRMARRPDQRWLGGTIPIIFHSVVAAFQGTFGTYHASLI